VESWFPSLPPWVATGCRQGGNDAGSMHARRQVYTARRPNSGKSWFDAGASRCGESKINAFNHATRSLTGAGAKWCMPETVIATGRDPGARNAKGSRIAAQALDCIW
jgi:hypothetical protein